MTVPVLGITPVTPNKKFTPNYQDSENYARCSYDYGNKYGTFLDAVAGEEDLNYYTYMTYSMVGKYKDVNEIIDDAGKSQCCREIVKLTN